ncbi:transporter [Streptomyces sp. NBC_00442]|uniref:transporter n=1 Tax=Streptomyces sp. NBC_00442 TaxID=2903651 RepID=UPI002E1CDF83
MTVSSTATSAAPPTVPPQGATALAPVFVRLKLSLLKNGLRRSGGRRAAYVTSAVLALLFAALQLLGLIALHGNEHAATVAVLCVAVVAVGWTVVPLFFPSGDETLDPTRLVMLPLRPGPLVGALLVASLVGIGPLFTLCLVLGAAIAVTHGAGAALLDVLAVPLALLVCLALARAVAAANTRLLTSRKGRDLAVLSGLVIAVGIQFVNFGMQRLGRSGGVTALDPAADVVRWLPPASAIGAVDSVSEGAYARAAVQLLLSVGALGLLLYAWKRSLVKLMTTPDGSTLAASDASRKESTGRGLTSLLPDGRTGTAMLRTLRYAWRDPKTKASWITSLAIGLIVPVFNALQGAGTVYFACFATGMLGMQMYNQFGQDTSAFWMVLLSISSTRDAYLELRARALALLLVTLPYTVLVAAVTAGMLGDWAKLPEVVGLALSLLGAMLATGSVASATLAYSIPQDSRKNVAPGQGGIAALSIFGGMVVSAVLCAPMIALAIWLHVSGHHAGLWVLLPLGAVYGGLVCWAGLRVAARRTADRLPEILSAVSTG